ncbi:aldo/keto reductase [Streptomyces sp. UG1]|uniref:aldo/keto reductase n=1 Tax=Streptomyces sp. UG1 TaxID=3417652 RepID=UPI003CF48ED4
MRTRRLGHSGPVVSEFALGTMTFGMRGWGCDEATATALVDRYLEAGGNFLDTADAYGSAEEICGRALKGRRERVVLGTKAGLPVGAGPDDGGTGRVHLTAACERSLRRLDTDHIDIFWIHVDDERTPLEETLRALDDLVRSGKVRHIGVSNIRAYRLMQALAVGDRLGTDRLIALQGQYNLIVRTLEREHFPLVAQEGLGFVGWSPLGAGMLTGKITPGQPSQDTRLGQRTVALDRLIKNEHGFRVAAAVRRGARELGCTPAQLALAWLRTRPVTAVIIGARTQAQLAENLAALDVVVPPQLAADLQEASRLPDEYPGTFIDIVQGWLHDPRSMRAGPADA